MTNPEMRNGPLRIAALIDPESVFAEDPDFEGKVRNLLLEMEFHVIESLRMLGHTVIPVPAVDDIQQLIQALKEAEPELVFNLTEHHNGDRRMDVCLAGLLDLLKLPYTGGNTRSLLLCRHKALSKQLLMAYGIAVPGFCCIPPDDIRDAAKLDYPLLIKPAQEDGSDGISLSSLVTNEDELRKRVKMIRRRMHQPAICEEYIEGRELYVGILGNEHLHVLPPREVIFSTKDQGGPPIATYKVKQDNDYRKKWKVHYRHARISQKRMEKIATVSKKIYKLLGLRDYGRIDFRVHPDGTVYFLEANANPDISMGDELAQAAMREHIAHEQLIDRIVCAARKRYGI